MASNEVQFYLIKSTPPADGLPFVSVGGVRIPPNARRLWGLTQAREKWNRQIRHSYINLQTKKRRFRIDHFQFRQKL